MNRNSSILFLFVYILTEKDVSNTKKKKKKIPKAKFEKKRMTLGQIYLGYNRYRQDLTEHTRDYTESQ